VASLLLCAGCTSPIGADRATTAQVYSQVEENALRNGRPGADTLSILNRFDLQKLARSHPDDVVRRLHAYAVTNGERGLLLALSEMSYVAAEHLRRSVKPWDRHDPRDFYLGSAVYAWLFLFGDSHDSPPVAYDRSFRTACDFYNYSLGLALLEPRKTNGVVQIADGIRRLPVGEISLQLKDSPVTSRLNTFEKVILADQFRVRGLSVRNRDAGLGAPLICVGAQEPESAVRLCSPATAFLRLPFSLGSFTAEQPAPATLELYSPLQDSSTSVGNSTVPLEADLTAHRAYVLNQPTIWSLGRLDFLAPNKHVRSRLVLSQPYTPGRIPVVFVHGTFSSPVTWAEMGGSLEADKELRSHFQFWSFIYSSGNPLPISAGELRNALTETLRKLDPGGHDPALSNMVVIGHSQGGLLTKCTAIDTGDVLWRVVSTNSSDRPALTDAQQDKLRTLFVLHPLPFVRRVIFISTPHGGSYQAGNLVRRLAHRLVSLPKTALLSPDEITHVLHGSAAGRFLHGRMPTSLDSMSPDNPGLRVLSEIPVLPPIKAHSIISVQGQGDYHQGRDGLVAYNSAHQSYTESECIVRSFHTCLTAPATIQEVRRILHEHLNAETGSVTAPSSLEH